ncbi:MAG: hypothetical protein VW338_00220 [Rhodospirillaceae bacterium]
MADTKTNGVPETRTSLEFSDSEKRAIAEFVLEQYERRKDARKDEEMRWTEIDRQLRMDPEPRMDARTGKPVEGSGWMPQLEMHTQAQAHEALTADARRLIFPKDKSWFTAHALMTDDWLEASKDFTFIPGMKNDMPSSGVDQEAADVIVESAINHWHGMYSFRAHIDQIFGQAFSYGMGVARVRMMRVSKSTTDYRGGGVADGRLIPAVIPRSIRDTYLDSTPSAVMREGFMVAPVNIECCRMRLADLKMAAAQGSTDTGSERGGWQRELLFAIEDDPLKPDIEVLDFEGDMMIPVSGSGSIYAPNMVGRVAFGRAGGPHLIRLAKRDFPFNSYLLFPYHRVFMDNAYATSPIIMGSPLHKALTESVNRLMQAAALNVQPPVQYDPNDQWLMATGGPDLSPNAAWPSQSDIKVHEVGNLAEMLQVFAILGGGHEDVTGVNKPRLGAQTKSHQTAFAVDSEIGRGLVRTVDFVADQMDNPFQNMLCMEYEMCRKAFTERPEPVFSHRWRMWMNIAREVLPERAIFETHGSAGPLEDRERAQKQMQALQALLQLEPVVVQMGQQPLNYEAIRRFILSEGGFPDVDQFLPAQPARPAIPAGPGDAGPAGGGPVGAGAPAAPAPDSADRIIAMATGGQG